MKSFIYHKLGLLSVILFLILLIGISKVFGLLVRDFSQNPEDALTNTAAGQSCKENMNAYLGPFRLDPSVLIPSIADDDFSVNDLNRYLNPDPPDPTLARQQFGELALSCSLSVIDFVRFLADINTLSSQELPAASAGDTPLELFNTLQYFQ